MFFLQIADGMLKTSDKMATQAPMINVTAETKANADEFMNTLTSMFETIEGLANDGSMKEGDYVKLSREFVKLSQMKERVKTTFVYIEQERVARRGRVIERKKLSKQQKLDDETQFKMCPSCKKVLKKKSFAKHFASGICKHISDVKGVVAYNTGAKKKDDRRVKLSEKRIFGGRSIAERSLILAERLRFIPLECDTFLGWGRYIKIHKYFENGDLDCVRDMWIYYDLGSKVYYGCGYRPTLKYGTEHKIVWVKTEPYEKSTLIPYLRKCWAETMERVVIPNGLKIFTKTKLRKSSWRRTGKGKWRHPKLNKAVEKKKKDIISTHDCEFCEGVIVEARDVYYDDIEKWVCSKCESLKCNV